MTAKRKTKRCGAKWGKRHNLTCRRLAGHTGQHAMRLTIREHLIIGPPRRG